MPSKSKRKVTVDNSKDGSEGSSRRQSVFERLGSNAVIPPSQSQEGSRHSRAEPEKCRNWMRTGMCSFGSTCRYEHTNYSSSSQQRKSDRNINEKDLRHKVRSKRKASRSRDEKSPPSSPKKSKTSSAASSSATGGASSSKKSDHGSDSKIKSTVVVTRQRSPHSEADAAEKDTPQLPTQQQAPPPPPPQQQVTPSVQQTSQPKEWEDDDWPLDASQLDYKEELTLEMKRQQLQRELELELQKEKMLSDSVTITKAVVSRSASQSTSSDSSSSGGSSSSSSSSGSSSGSSSSSSSSGEESEGDSDSSSSDSSSSIPVKAGASAATTSHHAAKASRSSKTSKKSAKEGYSRESESTHKSTESSSKSKSTSQRSKGESVSSFIHKKAASPEDKGSKGKQSKERKGRSSKRTIKGAASNELTSPSSGRKGKSSRSGSRHSKQWQSGSEDPDRSLSKSRRHKKKKNQSSKAKEQSHRSQTSSLLQSGSPSRHSSSSSQVTRKHRQDTEPVRDKYSDHHLDYPSGSRDQSKESQQHSSRHGRTPSPSHPSAAYSESKDYHRGRPETKRASIERKHSTGYEDRYGKKGKKISSKSVSPKRDTSRHRESQPAARDSSREPSRLVQQVDHRDRGQGPGDRRRVSPSPPLRETIRESTVREDSRRLLPPSRLDSPKKHGIQKNVKGRSIVYADEPLMNQASKFSSSLGSGSRHSPDHRLEKSHQDKGPDVKQRRGPDCELGSRDKRKSDSAFGSSGWDSRKAEPPPPPPPPPPAQSGFPLRDRHGNLMADSSHRKQSIKVRERSRGDPDKDRPDERRVHMLPTPPNDQPNSARDYGRHNSPPTRSSGGIRRIGADHEKSMGKGHKGDLHLPPLDHQQLSPLPPSQHSRPNSPPLLPPPRDRERVRDPHYPDSRRDRVLDYPMDSAPPPMPPVRGDYSPDRYPEYRYPPPRDHPEHEASHYKRGKDYDLPLMMSREDLYPSEMHPDHDPYPYRREEYLYPDELHPAEEWERYRSYPPDHDLLPPLSPPYRTSRGEMDHLPMDRYREVRGHPGEMHTNIRGGREEEGGGRLLERHQRGRSPPDWPRREEHWDQAQNPAVISGGGRQHIVDGQRSKSPSKRSRDRSPESHGSWDRSSTHGSLGSESHRPVPTRIKEESKLSTQISQRLIHRDKDKATSKKVKERESRKRSSSKSPPPKLLEPKRPRSSRDPKDGKESGGRFGKDTKEVKDGKEPREAKESREPKEVRESRDPREQKEPRESREQRDGKESREPRDMKEPRETREPRDPRDGKDTREMKDSRELKEMREPTEVRETREPRSQKETKEPKEGKEIKDVRESRDIREPREKERDSRETREPREVRESRDTRNLKEAKETRNSRDSKELRELRESRDGRDSKETRDSKEPRETKEAREQQEQKGVKEPQEGREICEPKDSEETRKIQELKEPKEVKPKDVRDSAEPKLPKHIKEVERKIKQELPDVEDIVTKVIKQEKRSPSPEPVKVRSNSPVAPMVVVKSEPLSPERLPAGDVSPNIEALKVPGKLFVKDETEDVENFSDWSDDEADEILNRLDLEEDECLPIKTEVVDSKEKELFSKDISVKTNPALTTELVKQNSPSTVDRGRERRDRSRESSSSRSRRSRSSDGRNPTERPRDDYRGRKETAPIKEEQEDDVSQNTAFSAAESSSEKTKAEVEDIDYDPISDDDLEAIIGEPEDDAKPATTEAEKTGLTDVLGVDWASLASESAPKTPAQQGSARKRFLAANVLHRIGFSQAWAGPELTSKLVDFCSKQLEELAAEEGGDDKSLPRPTFTLNHPVAALHVAVEQNCRNRENVLLQQVGPFRRALSARHDLLIRRQLARNHGKVAFTNTNSVSYTRQTNVDKDIFKLSLELFRKAKLPQIASVS